MGEAAGVARVSLSLPPKLLERFDEISDKAGFKDRSKAIQTTMRNFITEQEQAYGDRGHITGALLMIYNHEARGIDATLTDIEHHSMKIIASSTHIHLDAARCLKVVVVRGSISEVRTIETRLRNVKGVMQLKLSFLKTESD